MNNWIPTTEDPKEVIQKVLVRLINGEIRQVTRIAVSPPKYQEIILAEDLSESEGKQFNDVTHYRILED